MDFTLKTPVLLIAFNRPRTTKKVFQKIREAKPEKLYVTTDGPRDQVPSDAGLVREVQEIVQNVDWPCETHYHFNKSNKGAEVSVSSAINWVLEREESVIILEDDIIAPISFFRFAQHMLERYKTEEKIWAITGVNFIENKFTKGNDYLFAKYGNTWGWATWRRVWENFDLNQKVVKKHLSYSFLKEITNSKLERQYYKKKFKQINNNGIGENSWDNIASYMHRSNQWLYIIPKKNLVKNIGTQGLHANGETQFHNRPVDENFKVLDHPINVECTTDYDKLYFKEFIKKRVSLISKIIRKIKRII